MIEFIFILLVIWGVFVAARRAREERQVPLPRKDRGLPPPQASPYAKAVALRRAQNPPRKRTAKKPVRKAKPFEISEVQVDLLIKGLPARTLEELRQQWLNLVRLDPSRHPQVIRFREALIAEWATRSRRARAYDDYFKWPSTEGGKGNGSLQFDAWHEEGMLSYLGYRVGATDGESGGTRQRILDMAFTESLPPVNDPAYHTSWGSPATAKRLRRLANEIARFVRHAKNKRSADMSSAIDDWELDLDYLYETDYVRRFGFGWPRV